VALFDGGGVSYRIVSDELDLLKTVTALLEDSAPPSRASERVLVDELARLRDEIAGTRDLLDRASLREQWNQRAALLEQLRAAGPARDVDPRSPYFAHLRLREGERERDLCLGKATRIERGLRIVDWRDAPISRVFYRYRQGDEYEEQIGGRPMTGQVLVRRLVTIRDVALERIEAPEGVFVRDASADGGFRRERSKASRLAGGEGSAMRAHAPGEGGRRRLGTDTGGVPQRADKRLPDIAGLLDPAQFALIARAASGFVVIRGAAGSGKTTVALHRIAYLAYRDADFDSKRTLCVVFSPALRNYVSHVLPALGVERVKVTTFRDWAVEQRRRLFPELPRQERADTPALVRRLKLHSALHAALEEQVRSHPAEKTREQVFDDWASVLCQAPLLERAFARAAPGAFSSEQLLEVSEWNRRRHEELLSWLDGDRDVDAELDAEDDALLLLAWQTRIGPLPRRRRRLLRYRHVAIDEVQDFSPLEVRVMLGCLDESRSITLAGDTQQHVMQESGFTSWTEFLRQLGAEGTPIDTLDVSYRSSREIMDFATAVLGDLRESESAPRTTRSGPAVELFQFTDHGACVAFLADALSQLAREEPLASVAVLTPSPEVSALYYAGLAKSDVPRLRWVQQQDFTFAPGVEVTEIEQVKGLEFDYVVLVEVTAAYYSETPAARRRLHVGATRAIHQLWLTAVGAPSALTAAAASAPLAPSAR
jgi:DNA helicase-2/ATP-dependent DNA helicase PcrA